MTFLNALLLGGMSAVSIPFIIHLWNRNRYRVEKWGAMHLLEVLVRQNRRRIRLEQLLLLAIRAAIPGILALCMARPVLTGMRALARDRPSSVVVLLDNSLSMEAGDAVRPNFVAARDECMGIVDAMPQGSEVAVVGMAGRIPSLALPVSNADRVRKGMSDAGHGFGVARAAQSLETAATLFTSHTHNADRELLIVSDFQHVSWSEEGTDGRVRAAELLKAKPVPPRIMLLPVGREITDNVAVHSVELSSPAVGIGQRVQIRAAIRDYGATDHAGLRAFLRVDGTERSAYHIDVAAGADTQVLFMHTFDAPGSHVVEVKVDADSLV